MIFYNEEHSKFYYEKSQSVPETDVYRHSLFYLLGLTDNTRRNFNNIYNTKENTINPEILDEAWQTSGSLAVIRLAFNLYNGYAGNHNDESDEKPIKYVVDNIFCKKEFAPYFYEAIKIRFELKEPQTK